MSWFLGYNPIYLWISYCVLSKGLVLKVVTLFSIVEYSHGNCKEYLLHWVGYPAEHDLWLPESELTQVPDVLALWKL